MTNGNTWNFVVAADDDDADDPRQCNYRTQSAQKQAAEFHDISNNNAHN